MASPFARRSALVAEHPFKRPGSLDFSVRSRSIRPLRESRDTFGKRFEIADHQSAARNQAQLKPLQDFSLQCFVEVSKNKITAEDEVKHPFGCALAYILQCECHGASILLVDAEFVACCHERLSSPFGRQLFQAARAITAPLGPSTPRSRYRLPRLVNAGSETGMPNADARLSQAYTVLHLRRSRRSSSSV